MFRKLYGAIVGERVIYQQINEYLAWKALRAPTMVQTEKPCLLAFCRLSGVNDVTEITASDIQKFHSHLKTQLATFYLEQVSMRSIRGLLRYYHARGYPCPSAVVARV